jgi:hypothetical protein
MDSGQSRELYSGRQEQVASFRHSRRIHSTNPLIRPGMQSRTSTTIPQIRLPKEGRLFPSLAFTTEAFTYGVPPRAFAGSTTRLSNPLSLSPIASTRIKPTPSTITLLAPRSWHSTLTRLPSTAPSSSRARLPSLAPRARFVLPCSSSLLSTSTRSTEWVLTM